MSVTSRLRARLPDMVDYSRARLLADLGAGTAMALLSIPQSMAYAMIAGLDPKVGLYATMVPAVLGSAVRSSRHVIAGPTNAVSLLVGGGLAALAPQLGIPIAQAAITLALMVGIFQVAAGTLRLGAIVDYISAPVVLGYITGAGVLIGVGQLPNISGTPGAKGNILHSMTVWAQGLGQVHLLTLGIGLGCAAIVFISKRVDKRIPGAIIVMVLGIAGDYAFGLRGRGVATIADIGQVPAALPPLSMPSLEGAWVLLPLAIATTVLSLVEASAVGRSIAAVTGDRLKTNQDFIGQGVANLSAAFTGGYPVSGSLSRSSLNQQTGASSRVSGVISGIVVILLVLLAGPVVDHTPIAALAGLLLVVAYDLVNFTRIKMTLKTSRGDGLAFLATVIGCWVLSLDQAIYLGAGISLVVFLRRASMLKVSELVLEQGHLREIEEEEDSVHFVRIPGVRMLHLEGPLFFGSSGELRGLLDGQVDDPALKVLILRLRRTSGLDVTCTTVLGDAAELMKKKGVTLMLAGVRPDVMHKLRASGAAERVGSDNLFASQARWFEATDAAIARSLSITESDSPRVRDYLRQRAQFTESEAAQELSAETQPPQETQ